MKNEGVTRLEQAAIRLSARQELEDTARQVRAGRKAAGLVPSRRPKRKTKEEKKKRLELEEAMVGFRMARRSAGEVGSWVRMVRQTVDMPVNELAEKLGVLRWEVHRIERSEEAGRIGLWKLRTAAAALDCDLIYGLAPREGTLEGLAERQRKERKAAREVKRLEEEKAPEVKGWREVMRKGIRRYFRVLGIR